MTVRVYRSDNFGAPSVSGTVGELITVLDDCLVNGYGSQTITGITRVSNTATATCTSAHGILDKARYTISGATQTEYNGEFVVTVLTTTTFSYEVTGTPTTPATGTILGEQGGSGWTKTYTGTNKAAFTQGAGGSGFLLQVLDNSVVNAHTAHLRGYETMSDVDTGTNPFPTVAQSTNGLYMEKSLLDTTAVRDWIVVATESAIALLIDATDGANEVSLFSFGDLARQDGSTLYPTFIGGRNSATTYAHRLAEVKTTMTTTVTDMYMVRSYDDSVGSVAVGQHQDNVKAIGANYTGNAGLAYPSLGDSSLYLGDLWIHEPSNVIRGAIHLYKSVLHSRPLTDKDTFDATGDLAGKTFQAINLFSTGQVMLLIADSTE